MTTLLRLLENKGWSNEIDPYRWFQWYFRQWVEDRKMMKNKQKTVGRFRGKLVKMIKDIGSKFDDYSFSPKNRQIFFVNWILDNNLG